MSKITDAYFAGIFDGEGCVEAYIHTDRGKGNNFNAAMSVRNNDVALLSEMMDEYGGGLYKDRVECGRWKITGDDAVKFAERILPYLRTKRRQVEVFLDLMATRRKKGVPAVGAEKRVVYINEIKRLKRVS